jgi:LysM repeat protein
MEQTEYVIQDGDSLTKIAFKNSISISKLKKLNNIGNDDYLYPGRKLKIKEVPVQEGFELEHDVDLFAPELIRKRSNSVKGEFRTENNVGLVGKGLGKMVGRRNLGGRKIHIFTHLYAILD